MATGVDYVIDRIQEQIRITDKFATKICFLENVEHRHRFNERCIIDCASDIWQHYTRSNVMPTMAQVTAEFESRLDQCMATYDVAILHLKSQYTLERDLQCAWTVALIETLTY